MIDPKSELTKREIKFTENATQLIVSCPKCGKDSHTYMGKENGIWDCKVCGEKGNFYGYIKFTESASPKETKVLSIETVKTCAARLVKDETIKTYLAERGITEKVIAQEKLGVTEEGNIAIPYFDARGNVAAIKIRRMDYEYKLQFYEEDLLHGRESKKPDKWYSIGKPGLYGVPSSETVLLCEGEWDRLAALSYGFKDVVAVPGCTRADLAEAFRGVKEVYICFDSDAPGQTGALEMASRLGLEKCKNVVLPKNDLNDCLIAGIPREEIKKTILAAKQFPVPGITTVERWEKEILWEFAHEGELRGKATGHIKLDQMTRGFKGGQLRIVSGFQSAGKTTWVMNEMLQYSKQHIASALFSFESDQVDVIMDMVKNLNGKPFASAKEIPAKLEELKLLPVYFFDDKNFKSSLSILAIKEMIKNVRDRYGVKFVALDNLQFLLNFDHRKVSHDEKVTELLTELKNFARTLDIHIVGMAHINRSAYGIRNREGVRVIPRPQVENLKGSSGYEQTADVVMFVHRDAGFETPEETRNDVEIIIAKNRPNKGMTGIIPFKYDPQTCSYHEV